MKEYTILKGQTDWRPREWPCPFVKFDRVRIECVPSESMQFNYIDPETGKVDLDWKDWKKIGGVALATPFTFWKLFFHDIDSIQLGWRWNPDLRVHEFAVYVNQNGDQIKYERSDQLLRIAAGEKAVLEIKYVSRKRYDAYLFSGDQTADDVNPFEIRTNYSNVYATSGAWYGGKNNSPGPYGGAAPKDMTMLQSIEIFK